MKYRLFIFIVFLSCFHLQAQVKVHYGMFANLNFPMVTGKPTDAVGRGLFSLGGFYQSPFTPYHSNKFLNSLDFTTELSMNYIGFRDKQTDFRYNRWNLTAGYRCEGQDIKGLSYYWNPFEKYNKEIKEGGK